MIVAALLVAVLQQPEEPKLTLVGRYVFSGRCREGRWTPVQLLVQNPLKEDFKATILLRWGATGPAQPKIVTWGSFLGGYGPSYELPVVIPQGSTRQHTVYVESTSPDRNSLWAFLIVNGETRYSFEIAGRPIDARATCVGVIGSSVAVGLPDEPTERALYAAADLPNRWYGHTIADRLIWTDADPAELVDPAQVEALRLWIAGGGHLVVARSKRDGLTDTFLSGLLPVVPKQTVTLKVFDSDMAVLDSTPKPGAEVVEERQGVPIHVEHRYGRGRVTFLAFSPLDPAFRDHAGAKSFWIQTLSLPTKIDEKAGTVIEDDLERTVGSTPLAQWATTFSEIPPPSLTWAFTLILVYIVLVGPVDYLILRVLNKMHLTWLTFTAYVIGFSAVALLAGSTLASHPSAVRELAVIDCLPDAQVTRGWCVTGVLTPVEDSFEITPEGPGDMIRTRDRQIFEGTYEESEGFGELVRPVRIVEGEAMSIRDWDFPRGSTRGAIREWCAAGAPPLTAVWTSDSLEVHNAFDGHLQEAVLYSTDGVRRLGNLPAGTRQIELKEPDFPSWADYLRSRPQDPLNMLPIGPSEKPAEGVMASMDASGWIDRDRALLVAIRRGGQYFHFDARDPARDSRAIVRVYLRRR